MPEQYYSTEQASVHAKAWCAKRPAWKRICDIPNSDALYYTWEELPIRIKKYWIRLYGEWDAKFAWEANGVRGCKVPYGFISGAGVFYKNACEVPRFHNLMMVFKVGKLRGR